MKIERISDNTLLFVREQGKETNIQLTYELVGMEHLSSDEKLSLLYLKTKDQALNYFKVIWECRNSPQHKVIRQEPIFEKKMVVNEETGVEEETLVEVGSKEIDETPINEDALPTAIAPAEEELHFVGFEFVKSHPASIKIVGPTLVETEQIVGYAAEIIDQYGERYIGDVKWENEVITATVPCEVTVKAEIGDLQTELVVKIEKRSKSANELELELEALKTLLMQMVAGTTK